MIIECKKIILYNDNKILISNYDNIDFISNEKIIVDKYNIIGCDLKIIELDNFSLTIKGKVKGVFLNYEEI